KLALRFDVSSSTSDNLIVGAMKFIEFRKLLIAIIEYLLYVSYEPILRQQEIYQISL
ncbi:unnamed protein product, partial [Rotaria magnacalcarata]